MRHLTPFTASAAPLLLLAGLISQPAFAASICDSVSGNLVVNCGFESNSFNPGWTVTGAQKANDNVLLLTTGGGFSVNSGLYAAQLGAGNPAYVNSPSPTPDPGFGDTLSQTITDTPGELGTLTFELKDEASGFAGYSTFNASVDGKSLVSLGSPVSQAGVYVLYTGTFLTTGTDVLTFAYQNDPSYFDLDDVTVTESPSATPAVPEPSSILLFGTGLGAVAGAVRRRVSRA